jgi:hypothetical protein
LVGVLIGTALAVLLIGVYLFGYVLGLPQTVVASTNGATTQLTLQTVAAFGQSPHPSWVSYLVKNQSGAWVHSTIFQLPANSTVHVVIINFDGDSGLRNPFLSQPRGLVGGIRVNGQRVPALNPDLVSHTFSVPDLGLSVPIKGVADNAPKQCAVAAPCPLSAAHTVTTFTFHTGKAGWYRWQCFVPCAAGWLMGNGGPMQTVGYMDGFLHVV